MSDAPDSTPLGRLRERLDGCPEWWIWGLAAGAWGMMLPHALASSGAPCHQASFLADLRAWMGMVVAMMVPLMATSVRWTAERSLRARQLRAMIEYLLGYLLPWLLLGLAVAYLLGRPSLHDPRLPSAAFAVAGVWILTPLHERLSAARHEVIPLAPDGIRADVDCVYFGVRQGIPCLLSCLPLMLGCTFSGHGFVAMVGGAALGAGERLPRSLRWVLPAGCAALAIWYGVIAWAR